MPAAENPLAQTQKPNLDKATSPYGCLLRIYWALFGNAILLLSAANILMAQKPGWSIGDVIFLAGLITLPIVRYADLKYCNGETSSGRPATMSDWRQYTLYLMLAGLTLLGVAHLISYSLH